MKKPPAASWTSCAQTLLSSVEQEVSVYRFVGFSPVLTLFTLNTVLCSTSNLEMLTVAAEKYSVVTRYYRYCPQRYKARGNLR